MAKVCFPWSSPPSPLFFGLFTIGCAVFKPSWRHTRIGGSETIDHSSSLKWGHSERFYEKVIKVKADVAASPFFLRHRGNLPRGKERCQGRRFLAFILTLDSSPRHFMIELGTKRNAVRWNFVP